MDDKIYNPDDYVSSERWTPPGGAAPDAKREPKKSRRKRSMESALRKVVRENREIAAHPEWADLPEEQQRERARWELRDRLQHPSFAAYNVHQRKRCRLLAAWKAKKAEIETLKAKHAQLVKDSAKAGKKLSREEADDLFEDTLNEFHESKKKLPQPTKFKVRKVPLRAWLYAGHFIRGFLSATVSPGGYGKSSVQLLEAVLMATGCDLAVKFGFGGKEPARQARKPLKVWYVNGEDPVDEIERRVQAIINRFDIPAELVEENLFLDSGHDTGFVFAREDRKGVSVSRVVVDAVIDSVLTNNIDVLILDPLISFHAVSENDNTGMQAVVGVLAGIANATDIALELAIHARKPDGKEVDAEDLRGAGAQHDKLRALRLVNRVSEKERKEFEAAGIAADVIDDLINVARGKGNMTKRSEKNRQWFHLVGVDLKNGPWGAPGDVVGACEPWDRPVKTKAEEESEAEPDTARPGDAEDKAKMAAWVFARNEKGQFVSDQPGANNYLPRMYPKKQSGQTRHTKLTKGQIEAERIMGLLFDDDVFMSVEARGDKKKIVKFEPRKLPWPPREEPASDAEPDASYALDA
jgi:hypothetical protein